jgi:hypothetical protein
MPRPRGNRKYHQGLFTPQHPEKYVGDVKQIVYRSGWELKFMTRLDRNPQVVSWASEEICVPYHDPVRKKTRRYFPDFLVKFKDGTVTMIEIKPMKEMSPPKKGRRLRKSFITEAATYLTNQAKWDSAERFCDAKGWKFEVLHEKDLGIR